jgi:hypothetical protein
MHSLEWLILAASGAGDGQPEPCRRPRVARQRLARIQPNPWRGGPPGGDAETVAPALGPPTGTKRLHSG